MRIWDDNEFPLAYLITFRTYGTWLHGDERGWYAKQRPIVERTIREVCDFRGWKVSAINVRTNHAHVVVSAATVPEKVMKDFKAYATRGLRTAGLWNFSHSPWVDGGSKRYLWSETSVTNACEYVVNGQGADLPESF